MSQQYIVAGPGTNSSKINNATLNDFLRLGNKIYAKDVLCAGLNMLQGIEIH